MRVKCSLFAAVAAAFGLLAASPALAHEGGHQGGCEEFGKINRLVGQDPAAYGFPGARNLGDIVSGLATADDGQPGVGDVVEEVDHAACT